MALIQSQVSYLKRDTTNMALINHNVRAYEIFKQVQETKKIKEEEINTLKTQLEEMKALLNLALNR